MKNFGEKNMTVAEDNYEYEQLWSTSVHKIELYEKKLVVLSWETTDILEENCELNYKMGT